MKIKSSLKSNLGILLGLLLGILTGYIDNTLLNQAAETTSHLFTTALKLISGPVIFFSILSSISNMDNIAEFKNIGKKIIKYTFFTTYCAAVVALVFFIAINPTQTSLSLLPDQTTTVAHNHYLPYLLQIIPSNLITPFLENNVMSILFLALLLSLAVLTLTPAQRKPLQTLLTSLNTLFMKIASWLIVVIPLAIWSFITIFIREIQGNFRIEPILLYLTVILLSNLTQGFVILPLLMKFRGLSPWALARHMLPALTLAFFSKSSSATLPMTMKCAVDRAGFSRSLPNIAFPLCTAINMNGCAAFILITVLFVSISQGHTFSGMELGLWTIAATIAAIGNAGVPMGCYFLSTAFLVAMNVPIEIMSIILPFYAFLDMLETAINVWSDSCVVALVEHETKSVQDISKLPANQSIIEDS